MITPPTTELGGRGGGFARWPRRPGAGRAVPPDVIAVRPLPRGTPSIDRWAIGIRSRAAASAASTAADSSAALRRTSSELPHHRVQQGGQSPDRLHRREVRLGQYLAQQHSPCWPPDDRAGARVAEGGRHTQKRSHRPGVRGRPGRGVVCRSARLRRGSGATAECASTRPAVRSGLAGMRCQCAEVPWLCDMGTRGPDTHD